mmetsp:Transcript_47804/g.77784  ORF Transcript_47804/g.77784 Transcript_47804/m.77784 type:complete len:90 (-) Transcript_47804:117-386(-)
MRTPSPSGIGRPGIPRPGLLLLSTIVTKPIHKCTTTATTTTLVSAAIVVIPFPPISTVTAPTSVHTCECGWHVVVPTCETTTTATALAS